MQAGETVCSALQDHKPLRSPENYSDPCDGNDKPFAMQVGLHLGHEIHTDVLELQPAATPDIGAANAIAIALREATARYLGVEPEEMGYGISASRNALINTTLSIQLYDRAVGGAGYVVRAADNIRSILRAARGILDCPRRCAHACSACVLVSDAPEREEELDRMKAIAFMDAHLNLPDVISAEDVFAPDADIATRPLSEVDDWLHSRSQATVYFWTRLDDVTSLEEWAPTTLFSRWASNGRTVTLIVPRGTIEALDAAQVLYLRDYGSRHQVDIAEGDVPRFENGSVMFAYATDGSIGRAWASRDEAVVTAGGMWGADHSLPIAHAPLAFRPAISVVADDDALIAYAGAYGDRRNLDVVLAVGHLPHKRSLTLKYATGRELTVDLDQGFGWLAYDGQDRFFDVSMPPHIAASRVANVAGSVRRRHDHDSQMVVWRS